MIRLCGAAALVLTAASMTACVYSSDSPIPNSSGSTAQSSDGTDPSTDSTGTGSGSGSGSGTGSGSGSGSGQGSGSGSDAGTTTGTDSGTGGGTDSGTTSGGANSWTTVYAAYFGPGSVGHCGNSGCHSGSKSGFKCGADKTTCYNGLVSAGYIDTATPKSSTLIDTQQSCLSWFGGNMPGGSNSKAATDVTAWVNAGALDN